jgi:D-xylulose reductase
MEPGVPKPDSLASRKGLYNLDPQVRFWATPPVDGCLIEEVLHPAAYTFSLPESVSFAEGAMVEPLAVAVHAVSKARMRPGDIVAVTGAGPIGMLIALVALAGGASQVVISDVALPKLALIGEYNGIVPVHAAERSLSDRVRELTNDWGADVVFEASGNSKAFPELLKSTAPGGVIVLVGMPLEPVAVEVTMLQIREIRIETVFRYANVFDRAIRLLASGKVNVQPLISATYGFDESVQAFQRAASAVPSDVKLQICFG